MSARLEVGDTLTARAMNGHVFEYRVVGFYSDGTPKTSQWDAVHDDSCPCWSSDDFEPVPDW